MREAIYPELKTGDMVRVDDRGPDEFMVFSVTEHTARIRRWPLVDAPLAEEVLRSKLTIMGEGNE